MAEMAKSDAHMVKVIKKKLILLILSGFTWKLVVKSYIIQNKAAVSFK